MLINRNYFIFNIHSDKCIELYYNKIPIIKNEIEEKEEINKHVHEYLEIIIFYNRKNVKNYIFNLHKEKEYKFVFTNKDITLIIQNFKIIFFFKRYRYKE